MVSVWERGAGPISGVVSVNLVWGNGCHGPIPVYFSGKIAGTGFTD